MSSYLAVCCVLAALVLSASKLADTPTLEHTLVNVLSCHSRDGDGGSYLVEQSRPSQPVLGPANSSSAHSLAIIKPQPTQWSSLSVPRCKDVSSVRLQESQIYSPAEEQSDS